MLFNSIEFLIFLPIVFILYWTAFGKSLKLQNLFVVLVSYLFYGWWDWRFLLLIAFTTFCSFASGLLIEHFRNNRTYARMVCGVNIVINLLILAVFKYYNFFVSTFCETFLGGTKQDLLLNVILPVGISFYTFQALSYSIDVYRNKIGATRDAVAFFAFVSFFPQLVAGPIERATNLLPQFLEKRNFDYMAAVDGMRQIIWGFFKKVVIADNCAVYVNRVFSDYGTESSSSLWMGAVFFSIQIYGDFSGYSDIAIGTGRLFGVKLMRNFNYPYFSRDIAEFWRRWHISLTTWFRDYVYIPLGGSRVTKLKVVRNTFIIFLISGFWHGANMTFVFWGVFHALLFIPLILCGQNRRYLNAVAENSHLPSLREFCSMFGTFCMATIGWILFRAETLTDGVRYFGNMFSVSLFTLPSGKFQVLQCVVMISVMILFEWINRTRQHGFEISRWPRHVRYMLYIGFCFVIWLFRGDSSSFIYFQF
ncbi:MBOAT family O-acyltransferase [Bacteroides sp.]